MALNSKKCANPLFEKWIFEWKQKSAQIGSKLEYTYGKALRSLRECPDVLNSGSECRKLYGFGDKLCQKIDDCLKEYRNENGQTSDSITNPLSTASSSSSPSSSVSPSSVSSLTTHKSQSQITDMFKKKKRPLNKSISSLISPLPKVARSKKKYIPSEGSGAYAILIALYKGDYEEGYDSMGKEQLKNAAQEFAAASMSVPNMGSHFTAFNSIKTLVNKKLVERCRERSVSYFLTDDGKEIAQKLYHMHYEKRNHEKVNAIPLESNGCNDWSDDMSDIEIPRSLSSQTNAIQLSTQSSQTSVSTQSSTLSRVYDNYSLLPQTFDIVLCIDSREQTSGVTKELRKTALMSSLQQRGIKVEMRTLAVGDFAWILQEKVQMGPVITSYVNNRFRKELIVDYVIERKRIDDLASSIKDRRWDEQKYRLKNCGVRKPMYIIEYFGGHSRRGDFGGIKYETLDQAIINAEIDGFLVKRCDNFEETVRYLTLMTRYLESYYRDCIVYSCTREEMINNEVTFNHFMTYNEFERSATKITNFTVTEMFAKHLLQIRGVSVNKAKIIIDNYPTLESLLDAYSIVENEKQKELLLSDLKCGLMERSFGPILSKKIYYHYCSKY